MSSFNLVDDPWIPVRWQDPRVNRPLVSLHDVFTHGHAIADLSCAPHERVALIRLLVCITQAAIGAPPTPNDWAGWGNDLAAAIPPYLEKWRDRFDLFGDGPRFLQVKIDDTKQAPRLEFLEFRLNNNDTVFDHHGGADRSYTSARVALNLLVLQNFYLPGSTGPPQNGGVKGAGPSINYLHSFVLGNSLHNSILLNCLDESVLAFFWQENVLKEMRPVWEIELDHRISTKAAAGISNSYLGRLVPMPCAIRLRENEQHIWISQGVEYLEFPDVQIREPSATVLAFEVKTKGKSVLKLLKSDPEKAIWRDLHCVVYVQKAARNAQSQCGPLIIQSHLSDERFASGEAAIWCGELIRSQGANGPTAKLEDLVEELFPAPAELFTPDGQSRYQQGVEFAAASEFLLRDIVKEYQNNLRPRPSRPNKDITKDYPMIPNAQRHYWYALDHQSGKLLSLLEGMFTERDPMGHWPFGQRHDDGTFDPWTAAVRRAMEDAYDHACSRQTPRQIQAYAAGLRVLFKSDKSKPTKKTTSTVSTP